jgi:predicted outer membrane repeat protein
MEIPDQWAAAAQANRKDTTCVHNTKSSKAVWAGVMLFGLSAIPGFAISCVGTVTNTNDSGAGSLRDAINAVPNGGTITFCISPLPATITLTSNELNIPRNMTISGPGSALLTISGGGNFRVFENDSATVAISGLTVKNGNGTAIFGTTVTPGPGGGIFNGGTMTLTDVTLTSNTSLEGGAIATEGTLTVNNSTITNNNAPCSATCNGQGGGIFNYHTVNVSGSTISNNTAGFFGGGIFNANTGGTNLVTVTNSTISGNSAVGEGGGIMNASGTIAIINSTISGNHAPGGTAGGNTAGGQSGGIENDGAATISGSTISGNTAGASGGGILNNSTSTLTMTNSTISGNTSGQGGGGLENIGTMSLSFLTISGNRTTAGCCGVKADGILNFGTATTVKSSLLANSTFTFGNCLFYPGYPVISDGNNISDDTSCTPGLTQPSDMNNVVSAGLDPAGLNNNGGPTQTIALLPGSPAIDVIPVANCTDTTGTPVTTDQRGVARPQGTACSIGAFEFAAPQLVVTRSLSRVGGVVVVTVTITNNGGNAANVQLTIAKIGTTATTDSLPITVGTLGPGAVSSPFDVHFPGSVGPTGARTTVTLDGTYTGGSFGGTARVTLP